MSGAVKQQTEQKKVFVNPFGAPFVPLAPVDYSSQQYVFRVQNMNVNKDTLVVTPVFEKIDLVEEIQKCKNLCGLEYMKQQLARGLAKPEDLIAKPEDFHDVTQVPQDVHTAARISDMTNDELAKLARIIGIQESEELTADLFEQRLKAYIQSNWKQPEQPADEVK